MVAFCVQFPLIILYKSARHFYISFSFIAHFWWDHTSSHEPQVIYLTQDLLKLKNSINTYILFAS